MVLFVVAVVLGAGAWAWRVYRQTSLWQRARVAARAGDWADVERALAGLAGYRRLDDEARRLRLTAARQRRDLPTAAAVLGELGGSEAEIAAARVEQGRLLLELNRLRDAEQAFRMATMASPASYAPRKARIGILGLERRGADQDEALWDLFERSASRPEARVEALCLLARGGPVIPGETLRPGEDEGAALARALEADPDDAPARAALAYFLRNRGRLDEVRRLLEPWAREQRDEPALGDEYLALLLDEGRLDEAGGLLAPPGGAVGRQPSARRQLLRGVWEAARGRRAEAIDAFRQAIAEDPRDPEPHHRLAQVLRAAGRDREATAEQAWVEAAQALRQLVGRLDYTSPDPAALARAAELCRAMGRDREADAWLALAQGSSPPGNVTR